MQCHNNNNCSFLKKYDNISFICPILGLQPRESGHIGFQYNKDFFKEFTQKLSLVPQWKGILLFLTWPQLFKRWITLSTGSDKSLSSG